MKHKCMKCVACDCYILGIETVHWVSTSRLLKHQSRLSPDNFEDPLPEDLIKCYQVEEEILHGCLLSPDATVHKRKEKGEK